MTISQLTEGDWIVHPIYGVGQVQGEDTKVLSGEKRQYYKVVTRDATYWLPMNWSGDTGIRGLASSNKVCKALAELGAEPAEMSIDFKKRRTVINAVFSTNSLLEFAGLMRDLYWRKRQKGLTDNETRAFDTLKERFVREWSVASGLKENDAYTKLERLLAHQLTEQEI